MLFREKQQVAICLAAGALMAGFVLLRYLPLRERIKTVKQTKAAELLAVSKGRAQSKQLTVLEEQLKTLAESIGDYEARIPRQREHGVFLRRVADLMNQYDLKEQIIRPAEQIKAKELNCIPVDMQCKGRLDDLFEFFKQLQSLDRVVRIEHVKLTNDADFGGEATMETRAVIYYGARLTEG